MTFTSWLVWTDQGAFREVAQDFAKDLAEYAADQAGLTGEERAAFIEEFVASFLGEDNDLMNDPSPVEVIGRLIEDPDEASNTLFIIEDFGMTFKRTVGPSTSTRQQTWGQINQRVR